jgi:hypothetical protein
MPVTLAVWRLGQKDHEFKANLDTFVRPSMLYWNKNSEEFMMHFQSFSENCEALKCTKKMRGTIKCQLDRIQKI